MASMSSRQRLLAALDNQEPDHTPCSFMLFNTLRSLSSSHEDFIERQLALGLDAYVQIPPRPPVLVNDHFNLHGLPVRYDPSVTIDEWIETVPGETFPIMVKEYHTPAGTLRAEVRQTEDWPWGDHVTFLDDFLAARSRKFIVTGPADLPALRYLLVPPTTEEIAAAKVESRPAVSLARSRDLLLAGGWGVGADLLGWVYGLENMVFALYDQPKFVQELLEIVATWNRGRMSALLDERLDLFIKRAWYENLDFFNPTLWRRFLKPILKADVELAHAKGAKFGYLITSNCMPLLDDFAEIGIDALIGVDPEQWDLAETKARLGGKVCLWGGVNGHHTVEEGTESLVREAVDEALRLMAPGGGFILSPVDNVRQPSEHSMDMARVFIDQWQARTGQK
ncbi:MAG: uroporphyrinogen decarboxylase family protein [Anaerolineae bacterium]